MEFFSIYSMHISWYYPVLLIFSFVHCKSNPDNFCLSRFVNFFCLLLAGDEVWTEQIAVGPTVAEWTRCDSTNFHSTSSIHATLTSFHTADLIFMRLHTHTHKGNIQVAHQRVSTWPTCTLNVAFIFCKCRRDLDSHWSAREPPSKTFTFLIEAKAVTLKSWCPAGQDISAFWTSAALQNGNTILTAIFLLRMQNKLSHLLLTHRFIKQDYEKSTSSGYFSVFSIPRFFRSFWSTLIYVHCLQLEGKHNTSIFECKKYCMFFPFCFK